MALINCPECGKEISENAISCPNCGNPIKNPQPTIVVKKDYKGKAKAFSITGVILFIISGIIGLATVGDMVAMKAQYITGGGGAYPILNFLINALTWVSLIILGIGIIYWIIYAANKEK